MTFIATVIAKKGAALIADSLVTTSRQVLEFEDFYEYLKSKTKDDGEIKIDTKEVINLFTTKPSHTKDFQEKLFEFDKFTAISTAGAAFLNDKSFEQIIAEAKAKNINKERLVIEELRDHFHQETIECLSNGKIVRESVLIVTNYSVDAHKTRVWKLYISRASKDDLKRENFSCVSFFEQTDFSNVVCEGQNRISEKILWGDVETIFDVIPKVAKKILADFAIEDDKISPTYIDELTKNTEMWPAGYSDDIKINKLTELSLQQAIGFASLLMRIERDIQKFTENIPTVGGNVKVAVIDDSGYRVLSGEDLKVPEF